MGFDLDSYRESAEAFIEELDREYYLHLAGRKPELALEPIYAKHVVLFERDAVEELHELASAAQGEEARRRGYLLHLALDGLLGEATKAEAQELARLEASLEVVADGSAVPYRQVPIEQANEADAARRNALEQASNALLAERLNPIHLEALERSHRICRDLGWPSYAAAYADVRGLDLAALKTRTSAVLAATEDAYAPSVDPELSRAELPPLGELRRADMPRFLRAPDLDGGFPAERLVPSFARTLAGLGIDLDRQANVHMDTEPRRTKSPRAFCSTPRVPDEIHLVIAPVGGREDFASLFHEGGHVEHYANTAPELAFEFRHLGDNAVTESFAFLLEHLTEDAGWLQGMLGLEPDRVVAHSRASKLVYLRRYCGKLAYELALHGAEPELSAMPDRYVELVGGPTRVTWPRETWLADVDGGFYVACYLRAWALEAIWRRSLRERFGERWFERAEAGEWLRGLWRQGQRLSAEELVAETVGQELRFDELIADLTAALRQPASGG
jgi:hypothetical protein